MNKPFVKAQQQDWAQSKAKEEFSETYQPDTVVLTPAAGSEPCTGRVA